MKYFNSKEEILDIQLTPFGKSMFSLGKFKPKFYSFSDEDIIYDIKAAGTSLEEEQNDIDVRVLENTPYFKPNARNISVIQNDDLYYYPWQAPVAETEQSEEYRFFDAKRKTLDLYVGTNQAKVNSLGSMNYDSQAAPKINLYILEGDEIRSFSNILSHTPSLDEYNREGHPDIRIPQINIDYVLRSTIVSPEVPEVILDTDSRTVETTRATDFMQENTNTGTPIIKIGQFYFLIEEENTSILHENFEIEVYEVQEEVDKDTASNVLNKLNFVKSYDDYSVQNGVLLSRSEIRQKVDNAFLYRTNKDIEDRKNDVDYYLEILSDAYEEISETVLCSFVSQIKAKGFAKDLSFECPDLSPVSSQQYDIYTSDMEPGDKC
jgi:hypothetical protein